MTTQARVHTGATLTDEGVVGVYRNQLTPRLAHDYASALGIYLCEVTEVESPGIVVAGDGRPLSPEFVAAACEGLRWAGCRALDLGATTAACLIRGLSSTSNVCGGLLVGNPTSDAHIVGLKFWGPDARPLSLEYGLEKLEQLVGASLDRPTRTHGGLDRVNVEDAYLAQLREDFHALRPLRFVLDTGCLPLRRYLRMLTTSVACEVIEAGGINHARNVRTDSRLPPALPGQLPRAQLRTLGQRVRECAAHFGLWIDGDGEAAHVVDDRGLHVPGDILLLILARHVLKEHVNAAVALEDNASPKVVSSLRKLGLHVIASGAKRAQMAAALRDSNAALGGGPSGRMFYALGAPPALPAADALKTLALLLGALSTTDRPLSEVAALG